MRFISYLRVSTEKQGKSGLGLEAQREMIAKHIGEGVLLAEYVEVVSGRKDARVELAKALAHARKAKATLVIAKLDRLSRKVSFIANLMESGVPFVATDRPQAGSFELHVYAALGEEEARLISKRTTEALAALKARGKRLGGFRNAGQLAASVAGTIAAADARCATVKPMAHTLRDAGQSLRQIAATLTARGISTPRGKEWTATAVANMLAR